MGDIHGIANTESNLEEHKKRLAPRVSARIVCLEMGRFTRFFIG